MSFQQDGPPSRIQCGRMSADPFADNAMPPRNLGLVVLRGPNIVLISPTDGSAGTFEVPKPYGRDQESEAEEDADLSAEIENPFT